MPSNLEGLIIRHSRIVVPRPEGLLFAGKSFITETGRSQEQVQKDLQESLYISHCGISWPLAPTSIYSAMKTPENTKEDPEPADEGLVVQPKYRSSNKNYLQELRSV